MSHIAAALAKSKGKTVTPPPETAITPSTPGLGVSMPPLPGAAPVSARKSRTPLIAGAAAALVLLAAAGYRVTRPPPSAPVASKSVAATPAPGKVSESVAANKQDQAAIAQALSAEKPAAVAPPTKAEPAPAGADEFHEAVRKFTVAAVMEGPNGRAVIDGRKVSVGTEVLTGLWLREIKGGRLVFRDAQENEYVRRF